jgi:hypothetical protein
MREGEWGGVNVEEEEEET